MKPENPKEPGRAGLAYLLETVESKQRSDIRYLQAPLSFKQRHRLRFHKRRPGYAHEVQPTRQDKSTLRYSIVLYYEGS